ncbi:MAG: tetratricopeptide repeat protein [Proteobacteria bacterium]|nr:tetratricopeptide repeat protein [Pseudomonadota bacterium]
MPKSPGPHGEELDIVDLPAPVGPPGLPSSLDPPRRPKSAGPAGSTGVNALARGGAGEGIVDLPTPVRQSGTIDVPDLLAPVTRGASQAPGQRSVTKPMGIPNRGSPGRRNSEIDLPVPVVPAEAADLPTPKSRPTTRGMAVTSEEPDLVAPKNLFSDLPAPVRRSGSPSASGDGFFGDTSASPNSANILDVPAPKGYFDNVPAPAADSAQQPEVPAPKGYFDNVPAPAADSAQQPEVPAPKGFFDNVPAPAADSAQQPEVPAPKGFFDDVPAPAGSAQQPDVPAPKGFFDDLPAPASGSASPASSDASPMDISLGPSTGPQPVDESSEQPFDFGELELEAPSGKPAEAAAQFDMGLGLPDQPVSSRGAPAQSGRSVPASPAAPVPAPPVMPEPSPPLMPEPSPPLMPEPSPPLMPEPSPPLMPEPSLELEQNALSSPSTFELSADSIELPTAGASEEPVRVQRARTLELEPPGTSDRKQQDTGPSLVLEPPRGRNQRTLPPEVPGAPLEVPGPTHAGGVSFDEVELPSIPSSEPDASIVAFEKPGKKPASPPRPKFRPSGLPGPDSDGEPIEIDEIAVKRTEGPKGTMSASVTLQRAKRRRARRIRIAIGLAVLTLCGAGAGGYYGYNHWQNEKERAAFVKEQVSAARKYMLSESSGHWLRAAAAAEQALGREVGNSEALGIAAQAHYAALLDTGLAARARLRAANRHIEVIAENAAAGPEVDKARALKAIVDGKSTEASGYLRSVFDLTPSDPDALLYDAWAHAAAKKHALAEKAFRKALEATPGRKLPAMVGLAKTLLAQGKRAEAGQLFSDVLEKNRDHIAALVGRAESSDVEDFSAREGLYLAILKRDHLDKEDPRAVARAWTLAGTEALKAGRIDEATTRFEKALKTNRDNLGARLGIAKVAMAKEDLANARKNLELVLKADPTRLDAALTHAELYVREGNLDQAETLADKLVERDGDIPDKLDVARVYLIRGRILEARAKAKNTDPGDAITAYQKAHELSGQTDVRPGVSLAELLLRSGRRARAREVLRQIEDKAATDPAIAIALGRAFADTDAPDLAEKWFRKAVEQKPDDAEAKYQLSRALAAQDRAEEAAEIMAAAFASAPEREDIGLQLAVFYEQLQRDDNARAIYDKLLEASEPSVNVFTGAGRFLARTGDPKRAQEMGDRILAQRPDDPAGLYLRGIGQYAGGDYEAAKRSFREAATRGNDPRYLEAQGRAAEQLGSHEEALRVFIEASNMDRRYVDALLGQARIRLARRQFDKALKVLISARKLLPNNPQIQHNIGVCYQEKGEKEQAIDYFRRSLRLDDNNAETHFHLGQAYYDRSDLRRAARSLTTATRLAEPDSEWLAKAYLLLGYAQRSRNNRREAIAAWEAYLDLDPKNEAQVREVKRLLMRLKA